MLLSVLIPSLEWRYKTRDLLLFELYRQKANLPVEVIVDIDRKEVSTGFKRNRLLHKAIGEYIVFVDDDDEVYEEYISGILNSISTRPDCVGTCGHYSINGGNHKTLWKLSKDYEDHNGTDGILYRRANHLTPVKREHALAAQFPDLSNAEDKVYSERLNKFLKTEVIFTTPIYHYQYSTDNKEYV